MTTPAETKPLFRKSYGSIPHLPGSRIGPGDHTVPDGMQRIAQVKVRDRHDRVIVQEKVDGACTAVARQADGAMIALTRVGKPAHSHSFLHIRMFAVWADWNAIELMEVLRPGERLVGEWMAMTHGIKYDLPHGLWVVFDLFDTTGKRLPYDEFCARVGNRFPRPALLHDGPAVPAAGLLDTLGYGHHGAYDELAEGVVYRVERKGSVDFLTKYVRADMVPGKYMPFEPGALMVWNRVRGEIVTPGGIQANAY